MTKVSLNQQTTDKDLKAWMDDFLTRLLLRASIEHDIIHQDGTVEHGGPYAAKAASAK